MMATGINSGGGGGGGGVSLWQHFQGQIRHFDVAKRYFDIAFQQLFLLLLFLPRSHLGRV